MHFVRLTWQYNNTVTTKQTAKAHSVYIQLPKQNMHFWEYRDRLLKHLQLHENKTLKRLLPPTTIGSGCNCFRAARPALRVCMYEFVLSSVDQLINTIFHKPPDRMSPNYLQLWSCNKDELIRFSGLKVSHDQTTKSEGMHIDGSLLSCMYDFNPVSPNFFWLWQKWVYHRVQRHTGLTHPF